MTVLAALFALVALIYASVGFGGGSTYTALLALSDVEYRMIPIIALICNIIVVTGGTVRFARAGLLDLRQFIPMILVSAPMAFLGGLVPLSQGGFFLLLGGALFLSSIALLWPVDQVAPARLGRGGCLSISSVIGLLAGMSGIGGGIFMSPVLHVIRWSDARRIAAFASFYILLNSITGLIGQLVKGGLDNLVTPVSVHWPLMVAVFAGGQVGAVLGLKLLHPVWLRRMTAILVAYVAIRLLLRGAGFFL